MTKEVISILLVEDSDLDFKRIQVLLRYTEHADCYLYHAQSLATAVNTLKQQPVDIVLLDLGLPDTTGLDGVTTVTSKFPDLAVVVLTGHNDFQSGISAIQAGAQEYIVKSDVSSETLERAIFHARERKRVARKQAKFYRESLRSLVPESADLMALQQQCQLMRSTLEHVRDRVRTRMPSMVSEIDAVIHENTLPEEDVSRPSMGVSIPALARTVIERYSAVPEPVSTDSTLDPRGVITDVLTKYSKGAYGAR